MEFTVRAVVLGMKRFKGEVEGKQYDNTKVYVEESFASDNENGRGSAAVEYAAGKSDVFDTLKQHTFPLQANVRFETSSNGRGSQTVVRSIEPIKPTGAPTLKS